MQSHEHNEQAALFRWARLYQDKCPRLGMMFAIPNAQKMAGQTKEQKIRTIAKLKREGLKKGVPDLFLAVEQRVDGETIFAGLFIEMKYGKNKPTKEQKEWLLELYDGGYQVEVCYSWEAAAREICSYLGLDPEEFGIEGER